MHPSFPSKTLMPRDLGAVIPQLANEWKHPAEALSVLTLVGPNVIQCALAQLAGTQFTPVAFSFGWVAYSFNNLILTSGGGKLMPEPELSSLVINTTSSYARDNRSWVIARILRDLPYWLPQAVLDKVEEIVNAAQEKDRKENRSPRPKAGLCISVFSCSRAAGKPIHDIAYYSGFFVVSLQLVISVIPFAISGDWVPFLVTFSGILLAFVAGSLPQWREEKWGTCSSNKRVVLTRGNGAQHAIVIDGAEDAVDFEALAALEPISSRTTRVVSFILAVLWIVHLITLVRTDQDTWYFLAIGGIGMIHNIVVAGLHRRPAALGLHLDYVGCFADPKVMKALQAVEESYPGVGASMLPVFFPGKLRPEEEEFWDNKKKNQVMVSEKVMHTSISPPSRKSGDTTPEGPKISKGSP